MPFKENGTRINCRELVELQPEERMSQSKEKLTIPPDKVEVKRGQFLKILPGCGQRATTNTSEDSLNEIVDINRETATQLKK